MAWATKIFVDENLSKDCSLTSYNIATRDCSGSDGPAYNSIQKAANQVSPGDTVLIRSGTYQEKVTMVNSGNEVEGYITFKNYAAETIVIDGDNGSIPSSGGLIYINSKSYLKFIGLIINDSNYYGILAKGDCKNIIIQDCEVSNSDEGGIVFENNGGYSSNVTIDACNVHHNNTRSQDSWHEAITLEGVRGFTVKNCEVHDNQNKEGIDAKYGATNGFIYGNHLYNNYDVGIYVDGATNIEIYNNIVRNGTGFLSGHGIMIATEDFANVNASNLKIYNNIIYDNMGAGINIYGEAGMYVEDSVIINNTLVNNAKAGIWFMSNPNHKNNIIKNNIFWQNGQGQNNRDLRTEQNTSLWNQQEISHNLFGSDSGTQAYGSDNIITSDIKFINESIRDFHIAYRSPAIDAGHSVSAPDKDFDGKSRPFGTSHDIGAYEFTNEGAPFPPINLRIIDVQLN
jgi:parallel beta-helix repeat protein